MTTPMKQKIEGGKKCNHLDSRCSCCADPECALFNEKHRHPFNPERYRKELLIIIEPVFQETGKAVSYLTATEAAQQGEALTMDEFEKKISTLSPDLCPAQPYYYNWMIKFAKLNKLKLPKVL